MKQLILIIAVLFISLNVNNEVNAQVVATNYGYQLTKQHVDVYAYFMAQALGKNLTLQETTYVQQMAVNNFMANPVYLLTEANQLLAAKSNPYQSAAVVQNYRAAMQRQANPYQGYQQQANPYQNQGRGQQPIFNQQKEQMHKSTLDIINNMN